MLHVALDTGVRPRVREANQQLFKLVGRSIDVGFYQGAFICFFFGSLHFEYSIWFLCNDVHANVVY